MKYNEVVQKLKDIVYRWENIQEACNLIILAAVLWDSSDIHIEPLSSYVRLRYRLDWELTEILEYQNFLHSWIVARFKIMSDLKIDESRIPQDWKNWELIKKAISLPNGIILTSWPTGSWKSTTLYSALTDLNKIWVNIMTLEDPVENQIDGINQSQVKPDIWYTFAYGLRTALRQDPDIIMVWEMRDKETVDIAIEASLTWHLVLSTIHTNNASETITRMINMWVQPFLIPASVNIIIAQRLVRKLCPYCKKQVKINQLWKTIVEDIKNAIQITDKKELMSRVWDELKNPIFYEPVWCEHCNWLWYKWRVWLYEVLEITPWVKEMILAWNSAYNINNQAVKDWMISLEQDWIMKALNGLTSLEEVYRVAKSQKW